MIDEALYGITDKLRERLEWLHKHVYWRMSFEKCCKRLIKNIKPFYDFAAFCMDKNDGPYNPDMQWYYMRVYDRNDTVSREEFNQLREFDKVQYVLYHKWKNGEITKEQLKDFDWFELLFGKYFEK